MIEVHYITLALAKYEFQVLDLSDNRNPFEYCTGQLLSIIEHNQ